jgi:hypothetical protein
MANFEKKIAVIYLLRGADAYWDISCKNFVDSYSKFSAGLPHNLYIIFKGFTSKKELDRAENLLLAISFKKIFLQDNKFDIGAYIESTLYVKENLICFINTTSEIASNLWLSKLSTNLNLPKVGLVGATASFESLKAINNNFPCFPNPHIRSNAFMVKRKLFIKLTKNIKIINKLDAYEFESGVNSITNRVLRNGYKVMLVGANGRGYLPEFWGLSETFRQKAQDNLLIYDNQTRIFYNALFSNKSLIAKNTWGKFLGKIFRP